MEENARVSMIGDEIINRNCTILRLLFNAANGINSCRNHYDGDVCDSYQMAAAHCMYVLSSIETGEPPVFGAERAYGNDSLRVMLRCADFVAEVCGMYSRSEVNAETCLFGAADAVLNIILDLTLVAASYSADTIARRLETISNESLVGLRMTNEFRANGKSGKPEDSYLFKRARKAAEQLGGTIEASQDERGVTHITLSIPQEQADESDVLQKNRGRILIISKSPRTSLDMRGMLKTMGIETSIASYNEVL